MKKHRPQTNTDNNGQTQTEFGILQPPIKAVSVFVCLCLCLSVACVLGCDPSRNPEPIAKALTCNCPRVHVAGVMENRSPNYFDNSKFVLKDATGEIVVQPWLALEVAPPHPDALEEMQRRGDRWPPETMAAYLGVPLRLWGRIENKILIVDHAERAQ